MAMLEVAQLPKVEGRKTDRWLVQSKSQGSFLGSIGWFALWRQYCFFPNGNTVYNAGCLSDIQAFITARMKERR